MKIVKQGLSIAMQREGEPITQVRFFENFNERKKYKIISNRPSPTWALSETLEVLKKAKILTPLDLKFLKSKINNLIAEEEANSGRRNISTRIARH